MTVQEQVLAVMQGWTTIGKIARRTHQTRGVTCQIVQQLLQDQRVEQQASSPVSHKPTRLYRRVGQREQDF